MISTWGFSLNKFFLTSGNIQLKVFSKKMVVEFGGSLFKAGRACSGTTDYSRLFSTDNSVFHMYRHSLNDMVALPHVFWKVNFAICLGSINAFDSVSDIPQNLFEKVSISHGSLWLVKTLIHLIFSHQLLRALILSMEYIKNKNAKLWVPLQLHKVCS